MVTNMIATKSESIQGMLAAAQRVIGLHICFQARGQNLNLPLEWYTHTSPRCVSAKKRHYRSCVCFDMGEVPRELAGAPQGRVHTCPFGIQEIVVPVTSTGLLPCTLFAGPCNGREKRWFDDRLILMHGLAQEIGSVLCSETKASEPSRRKTIVKYIRENVDRDIDLDAIARCLFLSSSRARHVIRELFGKSLSQVVHTIKLQEAAHRLQTEDTPVGRIAMDLAYCDQSYFTRLFMAQFGMSPSEYRRRYQGEV